MVEGEEVMPDVTVESNTGEVVVQVPKAEYDALRAELARVQQELDARKVISDTHVDILREVKRQAEEIASLRAALRRLAIHEVPDGMRCRLCIGRWERGYTEQHGEVCLARLDAAPPPDQETRRVMTDEQASVAGGHWDEDARPDAAPAEARG